MTTTITPPANVPEAVLDAIAAVDVLETLLTELFMEGTLGGFDLEDMGFLPTVEIHLDALKAVWGPLPDPPEGDPREDEIIDSWVGFVDNEARVKRVRDQFVAHFARLSASSGEACAKAGAS